MKKIFFLFLLASIFLISSVSAIGSDLNGSVVLNATNGASMTFTIPITVFNFTVGASEIILNQVTCSNGLGNPSQVTHSTANTNLDSATYCAEGGGSSSVDAICEGALDGLNSFGGLIPLVIILLIAGSAIYFLVNSDAEGSYVDTEENTFGVVVALVIVAIGAAIIFAIVQSIGGTC